MAGLFAAVCIISEKFISIKIPGLMSIGITYTWYILMGLILKPFLSIITYIASDVINVATSSYGFSGYMYEYLLIYIGLILFVSFFKKIKNIKNNIFFWMFIILGNLIILVITFIFLLFNQDFVFLMTNSSGKISKWSSFNIDLTNNITKIIIWVLMSISLIFSLFLIIFYFFKRNEKLKNFILIYTIIIFVIVIFNWIFEPIVYIRMLEKFNYNKSYLDFYSVYLVARIVKSPIIFVLYPFIVTPLYNVYKIIEKNKIIKW